MRQSGPEDAAALFALFDRLNIDHVTRAHPPAFTVEQGRALKADMPGAHTKNLFLIDKSGALALVSAESETRIELKALSRALGLGRLSFAAPDLLQEVLGVAPGSVTALALINDRAHRVAFVLDAALMGAERVWFHPLRNDASTAVSPAGLRAFLTGLGRSAALVDFADPSAPARIDWPG